MTATPALEQGVFEGIYPQSQHVPRAPATRCVGGLIAALKGQLFACVYVYLCISPYTCIITRHSHAHMHLGYSGIHIRATSARQHLPRRQHVPRAPATHIVGGLIAALREQLLAYVYVYLPIYICGQLWRLIEHHARTYLERREQISKSTEFQVVKPFATNSHPAGFCFAAKTTSLDFVDMSLLELVTFPRFWGSSNKNIS